MTTTPDYAGLIRLLNALAIDFECDDERAAKETCDKAATALRALLERNAALGARVKEIEEEREKLRSLLGIAAAYLGSPAGGSFHGLRDDDAVALEISVRIGDLKSIRSALQ